MTMPCSITDLVMPSNDYEPEDSQNLNIADLSIDDLTSEDFYSFIHQTSKYHYKLELENMDGTIYASESNINKAGLDNLAHFCRSFLKAYEKFED